MKRIDIAWDLDEGLEDPHAVSAFDVTLEDDGSGATHTHKFHEFIYLLDGDAIQVYGDRQFPFTPGSLYFLPAGDWHIARSRTRARAVVLNFYDQAFAPSLPGDREGLAMVRALTEEARAGRPRVALSRNTATEVRGLLESAARECARHEPGWRSAVGIRLESLLLLLRRETALGRNIEVESTFSSLPLSHAERMERVLVHVRRHLGEPLRVAELSRLAGMGHSLFCRLFRELTGHTSVQYINRLRVEQASRILVETNLALPLVAERCGFPCLSHFHAVFRTLTGHSPRQYRVTRRGATHI